MAVAAATADGGDPGNGFVALLSALDLSPARALD
jgi:hypothetical protein